MSELDRSTGERHWQVLNDITDIEQPVHGRVITLTSCDNFGEHDRWYEGWPRFVADKRPDGGYCLLIPLGQEADSTRIQDEHAQLALKARTFSPRTSPARRSALVDDALLYADVGLAMVKLPFKIASMFQHPSRASDVPQDPAESDRPSVYRIQPRAEAAEVLLEADAVGRLSGFGEDGLFATSVLRTDKVELRSKGPMPLRCGSTFPLVSAGGLRTDSDTSERKTLRPICGRSPQQPPSDKPRSVKPYGQRAQGPLSTWISLLKGRSRREIPPDTPPCSRI